MTFAHARELREEKFATRRAIVPLLQAEEDRRYYNFPARCFANGAHRSNEYAWPSASPKLTLSIELSEREGITIYRMKHTCGHSAVLVQVG